jgi:Cdc6-like AAA superfamily ATPase
LKGTSDVIGLTPSPKGFLKLEDCSQTRGFKTFCRDVQLAVNGNAKLASEICRKGQIASSQFDAIRKDAAKIAEAIEMLERSFQPGHLRALRKRKRLPIDVIDKIIKEILLVAAFLFKEYTDIPELPRTSQIRNTYLFREAISIYLLALRWISDGGTGNVSAEKLRNDVVDTSYVAYATFFDGLLTRDNKMHQIYQEACFFLETLFN